MSDRVGEFMRANYGFVGKRWDDTYRALTALQAAIRVRSGQFVLLVEKEERNYGCTDNPSPCDFVFYERIYIGRLKGDSLLFGPHGRCSFPVGGHARCWNTEGALVQVGEGNIYPHDPHELGPNLNVLLERHAGTPWGHREPDYELEVKVGNEEVKGWFERRGGRYLAIHRRLTGLLETH